MFQYRAYVTVNLSCGLLDVRISSEVVELMSKVVHSITELIGSQVHIVVLYMYVHTSYCIFRGKIAIFSKFCDQYFFMVQNYL